MISKNPLGHVVLRGKIVFSLLIFSLILLNFSGVCHGEPHRNTSGKMLRSMARVSIASGEYSKAQALLERALELAEKNKVCDSERAVYLIDLAYLYRYQNNLGKAEKLCKEGLRLQEESLYENHPHIAYTLRTLASIHQAQNRHIQARAALDRAVMVMLCHHAADEHVMAPFYVDIGKLLTAQVNLTEAEEYFLKAISLINKSYGPNHLYTSTVLVDLAKLYTLQGKYSKAESLIDKALAVLEKSYGSKHFLTVPAFLTKAKICRATGNYTESEDPLRMALAAVHKTGNLARIVKFQQQAARVRAGYGAIAKVIEKD